MTMLPTGKAILLVMTEIDPDHEDDWNRWYDEEHIPQRLQFPGFLAARRFKLQPLDWPGARHISVQQGRTYLAIYELEGLEAMTSAEYEAAYTELTDWSKRVSCHQRDVIRSVYVALGPAGPST